MHLLLVLTLVGLLVVGSVSARSIEISSVQSGGAGSQIQVWANNTVSLDGYTFKLLWDPAVLNVTNAVNNQGAVLAGFSKSALPYTTGTGTITGLSLDSASLNLTGNYTLFTLTCNAQTTDGRASVIYIDTTYLPYIISEWDGTQSNDMKASYTLLNGTFTNADTTPPTVTITYPTSSTVPQDVNVTATITDMGGVAPGSWVVTVNDVNAPVINFASITNGYQINASLTGVPLGSAFINVSAQDNSSNTGRASKPVTVASTGFTFSPVLSGFTNQSEPVVNALFNQVNNNTVRMFIGSTPSAYVNVTDKCDILGSATDGSINLSYIRYGAMADGIYWVKVNGTSSLTGLPVSAEEAFTKDTTPPVVTITSIADSDGDGYAEAGELLTISYRVVDSNPDIVWIGTATNTTRPNGQLFYTPANGNLIGNINTTIHARDVANLESQSAPFHIYNNYLAYITDTSLGTMVGLNLSMTSVYDIFNTTAKAISISGANDAMHNPQLGEFNKTVTGGSKVVVDNRANEAIAAGALPQDVKIYATPVGMFDYSITVPHVTNATMILVRANSTMLNESITTRSFSQSNLKNLIDMNLIAIYSNGGVQVAGIDTSGNFVLGWGNGTVTLTNNNLPQTIRDNYINPSAGYSTAARGLSFDVGLNLTQGEYIVAAVCMDYDRFGIVAQMPFVVTAQPKTILSANLTAYPSGVPVNVSSTITGDYIGAVVLRNDVVYTGNMTVDFASLGPGSLKEMNLYADGNMSVMEKLISKIYITKGYGKFAKVQNSNSVEVPTDGLLPGPYYVYMFLEKGGNLTAFNQVNVTIGEAAGGRGNITVNVFAADQTPLPADIILSNWSVWSVSVPNTQNATFTGLRSGTSITDPNGIYEVRVNKTGGYLNVTANVSSITGMDRVVNITVANWSAMPILRTTQPSVLMSENGTSMTPGAIFFQNSTGALEEQRNYTMTVAGSDRVKIVVPVKMKQLAHQYLPTSVGIFANVTRNDMPMDFEFVNGSWIYNPADSYYKTTNATLLLSVPPNSNGAVINVTLWGIKRGDANANGVINTVDVAQMILLGGGYQSQFKGYDEADVNLQGQINTVDMARIILYNGGYIGPDY